jgi:hypothetical protein
MLSAVAPYPDGAHVALAEVLVAEATPRDPRLVVLPGLADSMLQLAPVALAVEEASVADSAAVAVVVVAGLAVIEEASVEVVVVEVGLVVAEEVSATNPMATVLPMVRQPVLAVPEVVDSAVTEGVVEASEVIAVEEAVTTTGAVVVVATMTEDLAAQTTSPSAAETGIVTAMVGMVEVAATMAAHGSVGTRATATTIRDSEGDTRPTSRLWCLAQGFVKGYLPFLRLDPFSSMGVRSTAIRLLTFDHSIGR